MALALGAACNDGPTEAQGSGPLTIGPSTASAGATETEGGDDDDDVSDDDDDATAGDDDDDDDDAADDDGPKFDTESPDGSIDMQEEEGCTKVDFLFVLDNSNSMATNQGELIASFPEFVAAIESTLTDVESFNVGVVTSDAYQFNAPGCTVEGAVVTQTGGVNSSNAVCDPFAAGHRYMTELDDLPNDFACAALVGTAGDNNEYMVGGMLGALSPELNAAGGCNDGFIREDALLVITLITDEDDPGSSLIGSPGTPDQWFDQVVAAKGVAENVVVLTLTRGAPGNACGPPQGSEVNGVRLMQFAAFFGANGFTGDICAASFGPFFEDAVGIIEDACESFMPPEG